MSQSEIIIVILCSIFGVILNLALTFLFFKRINTASKFIKKAIPKSKAQIISELLKKPDFVRKYRLDIKTNWYSTDYYIIERDMPLSDEDLKLAMTEKK